MGAGFCLFDIIMDKRRRASCQKERCTHDERQTSAETLLLAYTIPPCVPALSFRRRRLLRNVNRVKKRGESWNTA